MGRRSEQRIAVSLPVTVRGLDSRGNPFSITTETHDISFSGASLNGLAEIVAPGSKVEVESHGRKAWYRVHWISADRGAKGGRVGISCLERGRYIWGVAPKGWEPDTYEPADGYKSKSPHAAVSAAMESWTGPERRQFARHPCRLEAEITVQDGAEKLAGWITSLALGGCYFETPSPLPVESLIHLSFQVDNIALTPWGRVCASQPEVGMSVAFTSMRPLEFEALRKVAPPTAPPGKPAPPIVAGSPETMDAVASLLVRKGLVTAEELSAEVEKAKGRRVVVPA